MKIVFCSICLVVLISITASQAWAQGNSTSEHLSPMFNVASDQTNTYRNSMYKFSILPPPHWIIVDQSNKSNDSLVTFSNENPQSLAEFSIYYYAGVPISDSVLAMGDNQVLAMASSRLFNATKYTIYDEHVQRFSDGFVFQTIFSKKNATSSTPLIEEFAFWLKDGTQYFLILTTSQNGSNQNAIDFEKSVYTFYVDNLASTNVKIPTWIKNNAKWWSQGKIDDSNFVSGIQYLIDQKVMKIPAPSLNSNQSKTIPSWVKNTAGWWGSDQISDEEFVNALQYLITNGIIKI